VQVSSVPGVLAAFPDDTLDADQLELVIIGLMVVCAVALVFVFRTMQKITTRVVLALVLVAAGAGLWLQREALQDCAGECECRVFGQDVRVPDPDAFCPDR
jgi:hypothetical protein